MSNHLKICMYCIFHINTLLVLERPYWKPNSQLEVCDGESFYLHFPSWRSELERTTSQYLYHDSSITQTARESCRSEAVFVHCGLNIRRQVLQQETQWFSEHSWTFSEIREKRVTEVCVSAVSDDHMEPVCEVQRWKKYTIFLLK